MNQLERWIAAFHAMDDDCRRDNLIAMEGLALAFPKRGRAKLSLVHSSDLLAGVHQIPDVLNDYAPAPVVQCIK